MTTPNSMSTIHDQTATATTTGIAQTKISPAVSSRRIFEPSSARSRAISVPSAIVSETAAAVNASVRATTCQKRPSWRICE